MSVALMMVGFGMGQRVHVVVFIVQQMSAAGWVLRYVKAAGSVAMSGGRFSPWCFTTHIAAFSLRDVWRQKHGKIFQLFP
jgi:hypothetical protein